MDVDSSMVAENDQDSTVQNNEEREKIGETPSSPLSSSCGGSPAEQQPQQQGAAAATAAQMQHSPVVGPRLAPCYT
ncbi:serine/threonine-protein phosphatase 7 long form-like protein, partial [Trifolium medium]|nr:serine/threonine-protein phosphatase 7 long form-like protein [Trifolium medium]